MSGAAAQFNIFDTVVISIVGLSALVAFFRGFIRELLSLGAWVGAAIITLYLFPHSDNLLKSHIKNDHLAAGAGALGTYIAALIVISIINSIIIRYVKTGTEVGLLDNFLGFVFGGLRGAFIVSLGYLLMTAVIPQNNPPDWLKQSFTKVYVKQGADALVQVAPKYLNDIEGEVKKEADAVNAAKQNTGEAGYKPETQQDLQRLMDSTTLPQGAITQGVPQNGQ